MIFFSCVIWVTDASHVLLTVVETWKCEMMSWSHFLTLYHHPLCFAWERIRRRHDMTPHPYRHVLMSSLHVCKAFVCKDSRDSTKRNSSAHLYESQLHICLIWHEHNLATAKQRIYHLSFVSHPNVSWDTAQIEMLARDHHPWCSCSNSFEVRSRWVLHICVRGAS